MYTTSLPKSMWYFFFHLMEPTGVINATLIIAGINGQCLWIMTPNMTPKLLHLHWFIESSEAASIILINIWIHHTWVIFGWGLLNPIYYIHYTVPFTES